MTVGLLEAITSAIGESDTEIGGLYKTRLTSALQTGTALVGTYVWDGTLVVTTDDTVDIAVGYWVRLDSDGQWFEIDSFVPDTSVTILNPNSLVIPGTVPAPLSTQSSKAITSLPVETTLDWDDSGIVAVDGIVYHYTSTTATTFDGVTHVAGGLSRPGIFKIHRIESTVVDLNRSRNAIDLTRRSMLVDYAEDEYLDAIGRNHGVLRTRFISSDDTFREVIKALSYNPRGTVYGIELLLNALIGADNYELLEDLISYPNTVFIKLKGDLFQDDVTLGRTFLRGSELRPTDSSSQVTVLETPIHVTGIRLAPENRLTNCRVNYPSLNRRQRYEGDSWIPVWVVLGTGVSEGTEITRQGYVESLGFYGVTLTWDGTTTVLHDASSGITAGITWVRLDSDGQWFKVVEFVPDTSLVIENPDNLTIPSGSTNSSRTQESQGGIEFTLVPPTDTSLYEHEPRMSTPADAEVVLVATVPTGASNDSTYQTGIRLDDSARRAMVVIQSVTSNYRIGISAPGVAPTTYAELARDEVAEIVLRKVDTTWWELYVNRVLVERVAYASVTAGALPSFQFGHFSSAAATSNELQVKRAGFKYRDPTDYWGIQATDGVRVDNDNISSASAPWQIGVDEDKQFIIRTATNDVNRGVFSIKTVESTSEVEVRGFWYGPLASNPDVLNIAASVYVDGVPERIEIPEDSPYLFTYPDDIGKSVQVRNSSLGNDGTRVIDKLLEPGTLKDLSTYDTPITNLKTNIAEMASAYSGNVPESGLGWRVRPVFVAESGMGWEMVSAGSVSGDVLTLHALSVLPHPTVVEVDYSAVLSAQLLYNELSSNDETDTYHPFYLTDLIGFLRAYLDEITAAGVIPEYIQE